MTFRILLFCLVMCTAHLGLAYNPMDSLRTEKIKGKKYIIHGAEPKETLYSISKRYGVNLDDLYEYNPSLKENGLKMYDTIQVPILKKKKKEELEVVESQDFHIVQSGETLFAISRLYNLSVDSLAVINNLENANISIGDTLYIKPQSKSKPITSNIPSEVKFHIVQPSETLFGISRMYQVEIEDIQQWNNLPDYTLSIGQKLIVSGSLPAKPQKDTVAIAPIVKKVVDSSFVKPEKPTLDTLYVKTDNSQFKTKTKEVEGKKQTIEEGFAMKIEDTDYTKKFLALHRTAPLGSTIQVKNQMTNQVIDARVVGKLPESALNQNLLLRLSSAAYKAMGAIDLKTPIIVSYAQDAE